VLGFTAAHAGIGAAIAQAYRGVAAIQFDVESNV